MDTNAHECLGGDWENHRWTQMDTDGREIGRGLPAAICRGMGRGRNHEWTRMHTNGKGMGGACRLPSVRGEPQMDTDLISRHLTPDL